MFEVFPRDQVLVLPFDYFTSEQFDATNQILRFLNLTEITDPKKILKVRIQLDVELSQMFYLESVLRPVVHSSRGSDNVAENERNVRRILSTIQQGISRADAGQSIPFSTATSATTESK